MARLVFLDSGPLGLLAKPLGSAPGDRFRAWLERLKVGSLVYLPAIADYEVRRELLRVRAYDAVVRLQLLRKSLIFADLKDSALSQAAELWAEVRRKGIPTASPEALDADCILAAQALSTTGHGDTVTIATSNVRHLARFPGIEAREWGTIA